MISDMILAPHTLSTPKFVTLYSSSCLSPMFWLPDVLPLLRNGFNCSEPTSLAY